MNLASVVSYSLHQTVLLFTDTVSAQRFKRVQKFNDQSFKKKALKIS